MGDRPLLPSARVHPLGGDIQNAPDDTVCASIVYCFAAPGEDKSPVVLRPFWGAYHRATGHALAPSPSGRLAPDWPGCWSRTPLPWRGPRGGRRWYRSHGGVVLLQPVIGLLVALAPLLYVVWANTRYAVARRSPTWPTEAGARASSESMNRVSMY